MQEKVKPKIESDKKKANLNPKEKYVLAIATKLEKAIIKEEGKIQSTSNLPSSQMKDRLVQAKEVLKKMHSKTRNKEVRQVQPTVNHSDPETKKKESLGFYP